MIALTAIAQEVPDDSFQLPLIIPAFKKNSGPVLLIDEAHNNEGLLQNTYRPFKRLLEMDGYRLEFLHRQITSAALSKGDILVIINALALQNVNRSSIPVWPAFSLSEIKAVKNWVKHGGSLLLVADHMPFPAAAEVLAKEFGVHFTNGFAIDSATWDPLVFKKRDSSLIVHSITEGRNKNESIDSVGTFWGQAFTITRKNVKPLFTFKENTVSYYPDTAWRFYEMTKTISVKDWYQAATVQYGKGRVMILGEAGLLSAQLTGVKRAPMGMNTPQGKQNPQFILNAFHWLSGLLPPE